MITTILTVAASVFGGGGALGLLVKVGTWLGWKWIGSATALSIPIIGPVVAFVLRLAEKFVEVVGSRLLAGADHISKNVYSAALLVLVATLAWKFGPGDWRFWSAWTTEPPAVSQPAPRAPAAKRSAQRPVQRCTDPLSACFWGL